MAFRLLQPDSHALSADIPITSGQSLSVGQLCRLVSNRVRAAVSAGSDWVGLVASTSEGPTATGDAGGTVTARFWVLPANALLVTKYATTAAPGDQLDLGSDAASLTTLSAGDFRVVNQDSDGETIVAPIQQRLLLPAIPASAITANQAAAITNALGTPSASAPFGTVAAIAARIYQFTATGAAAAGNIAVTSLKSGITPAAGDIVLSVATYVTADKTQYHNRIVGATDFGAVLINDSGVKLEQILNSNLSTLTVVGTAMKVA